MHATDVCLCCAKDVCLRCATEVCLLCATDVCLRCATDVCLRCATDVCLRCATDVCLRCGSFGRDRTPYLSAENIQQFPLLTVDESNKGQTNWEPYDISFQLSLITLLPADCCFKEKNNCPTKGALPRLNERTLYISLGE